jgi:hypothetical protein
MKTYILKLQGSQTALEMAKCFALRSFSYFRIVTGFAYVRWICETETIEDVMEDINVSELERLGVNIKFFGE